MSQPAATILRNVFQFATILNQASNADVQKWDSISISNALDWADYCQELYQRLKCRPFENELNCQLAQMTMLLQPASCLYLSLDTLQDAKYLLVNTLISNRNTSTQLHGRLKATLAKKPDGNEILAKIEKQASRLQHAEEIFKSLLGLPEVTITRPRETETGFQADFLVNHLISVVSSAKKKNRFEDYCHAICDNVMQKPDGNEIFVSMFRVNPDNIDLEMHRWFHEVSGHLISWLRRQIEQDAVNCALLRADVTDVAYAASCHAEFFTIYLEALSTWTNSCVPEVLRPGCLVWRSPDGTPDSHTLTHHFECLLSKLSTCGDRSRRTQVVRLIAQQVQGGEYTAWRSIASHLLHLLKQG